MILRHGFDGLGCEIASVLLVWCQWAFRSARSLWCSLYSSRAQHSDIIILAFCILVNNIPPRLPSVPLELSTYSNDERCESHVHVHSRSPPPARQASGPVTGTSVAGRRSALLPFVPASSPIPKGRLGFPLLLLFLSLSWPVIGQFHPALFHTN